MLASHFSASKNVNKTERSAQNFIGLENWKFMNEKSFDTGFQPKIKENKTKSRINFLELTDWFLPDRMEKHKREHLSTCALDRQDAMSYYGRTEVCYDESPFKSVFSFADTIECTRKFSHM